MESKRRLLIRFLLPFLLLCTLANIGTRDVGATDKSANEALNHVASLVGSTVGTGQCVALINDYYRYLGVSAVSGNACDYAGNSLPVGWSRVPGGVPEAGDILVYTGAKYGHVAIYAGGTSSYHQNMSGKYVELKTNWNYNKSWYSSAEGGTKSYWGYIRPDFSGGNQGHDPVVTFDSIASPQPGQIHITGWAYDQDDPGAQLAIHVYKDSICLNGEVIANSYRQDVDNVHHCGAFHGFDVVINVREFGTYNVRVAALNVGGGNNAWSDEKAVAVQNPDPRIFLDEVNSPGPGMLHFRGWAYDPSDVSKTVDIHVYANGNQWVGAYKADKERADVHNAYGCGTYHGFDETIYTEKTGSMTLNAAGINIGIGENAWAVEKTVTVNKLTLTVSFNANGGSVSPGSKTVGYCETYGDLPTPSYDGYSFEGWYTDANGGSQVAKDTKVTKTANHSLYAHWKANSYRLDINGRLDGENASNLSSYGTCDVFINGSCAADDVSEYCQLLPLGTTYEIKDIKANVGYAYNGVNSGSLSGTIGSSNVTVVLDFEHPSAPVLEVTPGTRYRATYLSWGDTLRSTGYHVRIFKEDGTNLYGSGWRYVQGDSHGYSAFLEPGKYTAHVHSVNGDKNSWTISNVVSFTVTEDTLPSQGTLAKEAEGNHQLYRLYEGSFTWLQAEGLAKAYPGSFLEIGNASEQEVAAKLVADCQITAWIGGESYRNASWRWASGGELKYSNWANGEPNDAGGIEKCLGIYKDGTWNDFKDDTGTPRGFIVEYQPVGLSVSARDTVYFETENIDRTELTVKVTFEGGIVRETSDYTYSTTVSDNKVKITVQYGSLTAETTVTRLTGTGTLSLPKGMTVIEEESFRGTSAKWAVVPDGVTSIESLAFADCPNLRGVTIPASVSTIAEDAFQGSTNLTIVGESGSYAEYYAQAHNLVFNHSLNFFVTKIPSFVLVGR